MPFIKKVVVAVLMWEARLVLWRYKPRIIAITGSVGKTTTKDAVYAALSPTLFVRKSEKSFNSDIGVPLTILGLENAWHDPLRWFTNILRGLWCVAGNVSYPRWLILEVGADRPGDIRKIARWLKPHIVILTGVPDIPVHVEYFKSPEEVVHEKRALAEHLQEEGTLVLNGDDPRMLSLVSALEKKTVTYGLAATNEWSASHVAVAYERKRPTGVRFKLRNLKDTPQVSIRGALGRARIYAALAACAVADAVGLDAVSAARSLEAWTPPPGRMRILAGVNGSTIIDDTYNSSPVAALSALDSLKEAKASRRIAVLGDMLELGKYSSEAHRTMGTRAAECSDMLLTVGFRARASADAALDAGMPDINVRQYEQNESRRAGQELRAELKEGDIVLVKGSQSMRMERTVEELMAEPEKAADLLVRQEPEWLLK